VIDQSPQLSNLVIDPMPVQGRAGHRSVGNGLGVHGVGLGARGGVQGALSGH
jgi:hypothetical protein